MKKQLLMLAGGAILAVGLQGCDSDCTSEVNEERAACDERVADAVEAVHAEWQMLYDELFMEYDALNARFKEKTGAAAPRPTQPVATTPPKQEESGRVDVRGEQEGGQRLDVRDEKKEEGGRRLNVTGDER